MGAGRDLRADALIIGAGPAGATAAKRLVEAGMDVVCLEQGDWPDYGRARARELDFEMSAGKDWAWDPNLRAAPGDYPIDETDSDIDALMWNGVGGGSVVYACAWHRNLPSDFQVRSLDGVGDDWPINYDELVPYYERVEREFGVSGHPGDPAFPAPLGYPLPAAPLRQIGQRVARGHNELGWHWWPGSNAIATKPYGRLRGCVQRAACFWGCVDGAKGTVDRTHWPEVRAAGGRLITGARAQRIMTDRRDRATGVTWIDRDGREHVQYADVVLIAANGIGTPRLLLASNERHPDGLANSSGLVGRRLMMHPFAAVVGLFDDDLESWQGVWGQLAYSLQFYETDESRGFVRGAKWQLMPTGGPLGATRVFPFGEAPIWGENFHEEVRRRFGRSAVWGIIAEDLPDEANRVELDPDTTAADHTPGVRIVYRTSQNSKDLLAFHAARARESMQAAGASSAMIAPQLRQTGWHLLGTAKMGDDPGTSVVDRFGRCHDVDNLYVIDASVWPTSSGLNPTATVMAFALRTADHLVRLRQQQGVPA